MNLKILFLIIFVLILAATSVVFFFVSPGQLKYAVSNEKSIFSTTQAYILPLSEPSYIPILSQDLNKPRINAKAATIYDLRSGRFLFSQNTNLKIPIASLTKIVTAVVVSENLNSADTVTISKESIKVDGEKQELYLDEQLSVDDLLKLMLIKSSNDAAYALAVYAKSQNIDLIGAMNAKAAELGMISSHFLDPAGLDDNAYSSVDDLLKLVKYSFRYDKIWSLLSEKDVIVTSNDGKIAHDAKNTDQLLGIIPDIVGGKTGYTDGASGCLILVVNVPGKNDKLISIVLGSTSRFEDTQKLIDWIKASYSWQ